MHQSQLSPVVERTLRVLLLLFFFAPCVACAPAPARAPNSRFEANGAPSESSLPTTVVSAEGVTDAEELLAWAQIELENERYAEAIRRFEIVVQVAQSPNERLRGLLGWGTSLDLGGQPKAALGVYERYVAEAPLGSDREEIQVRLVRLHTYLEDYVLAAQIAQQIKTHKPPLGQIALHAATALAALAEGREQEAELAIGRGRSIIESERYDHLDPLPLDVAALYFALGELRRKKGELIEFDPIPADFSQALETRCQWILDAQSAYSQAMRAKDAHWSAMAGVSVGQLYHDLHRELTNMPRPSAADSAERRELFDGALRLRYSILLTKAASMLNATLALRDRDQARGNWVQRAEDTLHEIEDAQKTEEQAIDALPYTREQLQQGLDRLAEQVGRKVGHK